MNVTEPLSWDRNLRNRDVNMLENLTLLTVQTTSGPVGDILGESRPNKGTRNQSLARTNTRVRDVLESVKNPAAERNRN